MTNIVILVGNVGQDPETRATRGGSNITTVSLATSRRWKNDAGERQEETEWHRVTCFNGLGKNVAEYVRKGSKISVQGRIHYTSWTDNDGVKRYGTEIYANEIEFLSKAPEAQEPERQPTPKTPARGRGKAKVAEPDLDVNVDDDIPF